MTDRNASEEPDAAGTLAASDDRTVSMQHYTIQAAPNADKVRLDVCITNHVQYATRARVKLMIDAGTVLVNGRPVRKPGRMVQPGDVIECDVPRIVPQEITAEEIPLDILHEDDDLIIVNKPAGMVTHPAVGNHSGTLVNALMHHTRMLSTLRGEERAGILHRLDKDTSGILCVAKNNTAHAFLAEQFATHSIEREYWAVVWGNFTATDGLIDEPIARHKSDRRRMAVTEGGKRAVTEYHVERDFGPMALVRLILHTGRTHQIRVHLSHIHHPVFGDPKYGGRHIVYGTVTPAYKAFVNALLHVMPRQALHAKVLGIEHPTTRERTRFESELPADMRVMLEMLENYFLP